MVAVVDGDTLSVRAHIWLGQEVATLVRLAGIDAPELKGECESERARARAAREHLERLVAGGPVTLAQIRYEKYAGRVMAHVATADGQDLSQRMIAAGLVRAYDGGKRDKNTRPFHEYPLGSASGEGRASGPALQERILAARYNRRLSGTSPVRPRPARRDR